MNCPNLPNLSPEDIAKVTGEATEADDPTGFPGHSAGPTQLPRVETLLRGSSTKPEDMILRNIMVNWGRGRSLSFVLVFVVFFIIITLAAMCCVHVCYFNSCLSNMGLLP